MCKVGRVDRSQENTRTCWGSADAGRALLLFALEVADTVRTAVALAHWFVELQPNPPASRQGWNLRTPRQGEE